MRVVRNAVFSLPRHGYGDPPTHRTVLSRFWCPDWPRALVIMLNPSLASDFGDDPTIRVLTGYYQGRGFGGFWVANLFAFRSPYPVELWRAAPAVRIGPDTDAALAWMLADPQLKEVLVAWGAAPAARERASEIITLVRRQNFHPMCLGLTKDGAPRHPLRQKLPDHPVRFESGPAPSIEA